ncbi:MAG: ATP--guanido phosphotransferase [Lachnospiraceae bacterium]|nr:ATP--guanido phosphotransferase [Lachnospiraceae bacterium]
MNKWFEITGKPQGIVVSSRIRLARNIDGFVFPGKLQEEDRQKLLAVLRDGLAGFDLSYMDLKQMNQNEKKALKERRLINSAIASRNASMGLYTSEDESVSILLGGDDHLRMQCLLPGSALHKGWEIMDELDDRINEHFDYAFNEKYGYLTAFPTNMGTGLRASVLLHLPLISRERDFKRLMEEIGRMGISLKGLYGSDPGENYGSLFRLANQKTLGQSEKEIIENVERFAIQLAAQERQAENEIVRTKRGDVEDEVYKSFGVLRYARKLSFKECMMYLSQIRMGIANGLIQMKQPVNIHSLMVQAQPAGLMQYAGRTLSEEECRFVRAQFIRQNLPECEWK